MNAAPGSEDVRGAEASALFEGTINEIDEMKPRLEVRATKSGARQVK